MKSKLRENEILSKVFGPSLRTWHLKLRKNNYRRFLDEFYRVQSSFNLALSCSCVIFSLKACSLFVYRRFLTFLSVGSFKNCQFRNKNQSILMGLVRVILWLFINTYTDCLLMNSRFLANERQLGIRISRLRDIFVFLVARNQWGVIIIIIIIYSIYRALIPNGPKALYIIKITTKS